MDSLILSSEVSDLHSEMQRLKRIISGEEPHISSISPKSKDLEELDKAAEQAIKETKSGATSAGKQAKAIYTTASARDAIYSVRGRIFMRYAGVNGRIRAAYGRGVAMKKAKSLADKKKK